MQETCGLLLQELDIKHPPLSLKLLLLGGRGGAIEDRPSLFGVIDEIDTGGSTLRDEDVIGLEDVVCELDRSVTGPLLELGIDVKFEVRSDG